MIWICEECRQKWEPHEGDGGVIRCVYCGNRTRIPAPDQRPEMPDDVLAHTIALIDEFEGQTFRLTYKEPIASAMAAFWMALMDPEGTEAMALLTAARQ